MLAARGESAALKPRLGKTLTGLFAGLVAVGALHFNCLIHNAPHLVIWLACAAMGYLAGQYLGLVWPSIRGRFDSRSRSGAGGTR